MISEKYKALQYSVPQVVVSLRKSLDDKRYFEFFIPCDNDTALLATLYLSFTLSHWLILTSVFRVKTTKF